MSQARRKARAVCCASCAGDDARRQKPRNLRRPVFGQHQDRGNPRRSQDNGRDQHIRKLPAPPSVPAPPRRPPCFPCLPPDVCCSRTGGGAAAEGSARYSESHQVLSSEEPLTPATVPTALIADQIFRKTQPDGDPWFGGIPARRLHSGSWPAGQDSAASVSPTASARMRSSSERCPRLPPARSRSSSCATANGRATTIGSGLRSGWGWPWHSRSSV